MLKLLTTYKTQLLQINRALVETPDNTGLLKLKTSLEKMVKDESDSEPETTEDISTSNKTCKFDTISDDLCYSGAGHEAILENGNLESENVNCFKNQTKIEEIELCQPSVSKEYSNESKDEFEIPLEESLKAVEEFIIREKELSKWRIGENCLALWKGNGNYYSAKIEAISNSGQIDIVYDSYNVKDEVYYQNMHKFTGKKCTLADKANIKKSGKNVQKSCKLEEPFYKKNAFKSNSIPACKRNEKLRHVMNSVVPHL